MGFMGGGIRLSVVQKSVAPLNFEAVSNIHPLPTEVGRNVRVA